MKRPTLHRDRGVIFIAALILLAGMSVVVIAIANEVSLDLKMATSLVDADQALETAKVGIDKIVYALNNDANWRTTYTSGTKYGPFALGDGEFTVTLIDEDGDLADSLIDPVTVRSIATYKDTTRTVSAVLSPPPHEAMMYLAYAWHDLHIRLAPRIYGDICSEHKVDLHDSAPDFRGDIYAFSPGDVDDPLDDDDTDVITITTEPADPVPDAAWFVNRGSAMVPPDDGTLRITDKRITPSTNPHGFSNAEGIYYIDANGKNVEFRRCYIEATIVITRADKVFFEDGIVHRPALASYPALVVAGKDPGKGTVDYDLDLNLSESGSHVDFNGDGDMSDTFAPSVSGVVYASKRIRALQVEGDAKTVRFTGVLMSEDVELMGAGNILEQDPALSTNPVEQFHGVGMKLVKGSFKIE